MVIFPVRLWLSGSFPPPGGNSAGGGRRGRGDLPRRDDGNEAAIDQRNPVVSLTDPVGFVLITLAKTNGIPCVSLSRGHYRPTGSVPAIWEGD